MATSAFTKKGAIDYYRRVAKVLLPHLKNVPISFKRYPDTIDGESFWEKDAPSFTPKWVKTVAVPRRGEDESDIRYIVVNDVKTLTWLVSIGGIELHPFLHRAPKLDVATNVVFDLDPGAGADIDDCCDVALLLRDALAALKLKSFAKVSGSKGLQVHVPLNTNATHEATVAFARFVADALARAHPKRIVSKMAKQFRAKRVFIDWSQNAGYKTTVSVYSLRAKGGVSMPLTWGEVEKHSPLEFTPDAALRRIAKKGDLFAPVLKLKQKLPGSGRWPVTGGRRASGHRSPATGHSLPKEKSQSGRRLFVVVKTDQAGDELWLDVRGKFQRWILRPDREGGSQLIALFAGQFPVQKEYYAGKVPPEWRKRVKLEDAGAYELIEGSYERRRFDLWFTGKVLSGEWILEKINPEETHRSWRLSPVLRLHLP
ncbi:MAG TPA: non-homologous end-joining DNA ligase [Thermoanaerobaculia bacterium]|jgi:bifunctional non-homologous end joining protein LigD|nr:non-homologous end-joining DNA ligase [Thermoanaerobaculia bacterium]